ncbi:MAG: hypothetical protein IT437_07020 [Phycisphaerales bacterium]|nr:hypothetical protein [Phycisphaerales bacterium]
MTIDRDLYRKVTGRIPGEAANRMGDSLARAAAERARSVEQAGRDMPYSGRAYWPRTWWQWVALAALGTAGWIAAWRAGLFAGWI